MAYSLAQNPTVANGGGASSISKAFASTVTAHSLLVAFATTDATAPGTFTATGGGTWASIAAKKEPNSTQWLCILYCLDATGGTAPTVQVSWTGNGTFNGLLIAEFTNGGVASVLDANTAGSIGTNITPPTDSAMTATGADAVVSYAIAATGSVTPTVGAGFTFGTNQDTTDLAAWEYQVLSGAGSVTPVFTLSPAQSWGIISAAFAPVGGAAVAPMIPVQPGKTWLKQFKHRLVLALASDVSTPAAQTLTSAGIVSVEVFGDGTISLNVALTGITSGERFGTSVVSVTVASQGIQTAEQFGNTAVTQVVSAQGITTSERFGTGTLSLLTSPQGLLTGEQFGLSNVQTVTSILPQGIVTGEVFGTSTVTPGSVTVSPQGISTGEVFGDTTVSVGASSVLPVGITTGEVLGTPAITTSVTVTPLGISTGEVLGDVAVVQTVASVGIVSGEKLGLTNVQTVVSILPAGIQSAEVFGDAVVQPGSVTVAAVGIVTGEVFGNTTVSVGASQVTTQGIISGERLGTTTITVGSVTLSPTGIRTEERFGTTILSGQGLPQSVAVLGIVTAELFGIVNARYGSAQVNNSTQAGLVNASTQSGSLDSSVATATVNSSTQTATVSNSIQPVTI